MDLIILQDGLYHLYPVTKAMFAGALKPEIVDCFSLCDILREKLTVYQGDINKHILKSGSFFFGCVCS